MKKLEVINEIIQIYDAYEKIKQELFRTRELNEDLCSKNNKLTQENIKLKGKDISPCLSGRFGKFSKSITHLGKKEFLKKLFRDGVYMDIYWEKCYKGRGGILNSESNVMTFEEWLSTFKVRESIFKEQMIVEEYSIEELLNYFKDELKEAYDKKIEYYNRSIKHSTLDQLGIKEEK